MAKRLLQYKWYIIVILALIIIEPTVTSWLILWVQKMYNEVTIGTPRIEIIKLILIGVSVWTGKRILLFSISVVKSRFICNVKQDLKEDLFSSALGLNTATISQIATSGEYISAFTNDITIIEQRFFSNVIGVISQLISIVILGSTFFSMNRKLAVIMFLFGIIVMFVPPFFSKKLNNANLKYSKSLSKLTQKLKEYLHAFSTIKNYSIESIILKKFSVTNTEVEDAKFSYDCALSLADSIGSLLTWFTTILIIGAGLIMVSTGEIFLGTVIAAKEFSQELAAPLQKVVENVNSIKSVKSIIQRINDLTSGESTVPLDSHCSIQADSVDRLSVDYCNLTISIGDHKIVNDFSFSFRPGGKYLVIGRNGSGKSSLFKALKKQFKDYQGEIRINGIELRDISNSEISKIISYLNENVAIFTGSVENNITFGQTVSQEKYRHAIQDAHVEIESQRTIGEDGYNISSGEQRRIEIARSLLASAPLMVFDEVVSTLDIETAYEIEKMALDFAEKTIIFVSHNFSGKLMKKYDEILVMKDGTLVAHGPYEELLHSNEYFRKICSLKFGDQ